MAEKFVPKEATIGSLLKNNKFVIPKYQRYYSWSDEAKVFLQDFFDVNERREEYFTGPMIFSEEEKVLRIVDGQQRLITSTILLSAIRDLCNSKGLKTLSTSIEDRYLIEKEVYSSGDVRVSANRIDKELLNLIVQSNESYENKEQRIKEMIKGKKIDSWKNMSNVYFYFYEQLLKKVSDLEEDSEVEGIVKGVVQTFDELIKVISIEVKDDLEAYLIFETLNDRGLQLSISDLLKNYLFSQIGENEVDEFEIKWNNLLEDLSATQFIQLIRYYWISQKGFVRIKELFKEIKKDVKNATNAKNFIKNIDEFKKYYTQLTSPSFEYWKNQNIVNWLDDLHLCNFSQHIPVMFSLIKKKEKNVEKELWSIYSIIMRRILSGKNPNELEQRLPKICVEINKEKYNAISELMEEVNPSNEELVASIISGEFSSGKEEKLAKTALRLLNNNKSPELNTNKDLTLEHIWPRSRKAELAEPNNIYRIGNFTLLTSEDNSRLGNKDLVDKLEVLQQSDLLINKELAEWISTEATEEWIHWGIVDRSRAIAEKLAEILS